VLADAPVILADEPTADLDGATADEVRSALVDAARGKTLIVATHDGISLAGWIASSRCAAAASWKSIVTGMAAFLEVLVSSIRSTPWRFVGGIALAALTLAAGAGLLALSGYLIAGSAIAGMGLVAFDTVIPAPPYACLPSCVLLPVTPNGLQLTTLPFTSLRDCA